MFNSDLSARKPLTLLNINIKVNTLTGSVWFQHFFVLFVSQKGGDGGDGGGGSDCLYIPHRKNS